MADLDYEGYWNRGFSWGDYIAREVKENLSLWEGVYRKAAVPGWAVDEARRIGGDWKLLVISEDWCGDASNTVPVMARLAEAVPGVEMRIVKRDENTELMDAYLTGGSRSIPLAVVLDADLRPVGRWGPRPAELQAFVQREKAAATRPVEQIYRDVRQWYARDAGASTLREILAILAAHAV
ncbi:MAG TPA: thioredoxin family protein [Longimicrobiaceae bacterium]|jgi:hypothetical protein|nr:thioredoxin family protein [Longimicrobiaceae bacterium]